MKKNMPSTDNVNFDGGNFIMEKKGKITNDYEMLMVLGKGSYGEVRKAFHKLTGDQRAVKIFKKDDCDETFLKSLQNEINMLR